MNLFKDNLQTCLNAIKGSGSFLSTATLPFVFPRLFIENIGELPFPINDYLAKGLINEAHKAPFGRGTETILDDTVRRAWEINPDKLEFKGEEWTIFLSKILKNIKEDLGITDADVEACLYKMLIYEKGDFFLTHRDSEKEKGMFGTLIIGLPSVHQGGELLIRFDGEESVVNFAEASNNYKIPYVAFYADCEHEVRTVTAGFRVCLVYNLIQKKGRMPLNAEALGRYVDPIAKILVKHRENEKLAPGLVLLGHQYTPENFSLEQLKLNDRPRAVALIRAAESAGFYANLCLVTSYQSGQPAYNGYEWDVDLDEDAVMDEVFEDSLSITAWVKEGIPPIFVRELEEEDLITTFKINDGDPIEKEVTEYMGNYGPDLMHWYHYGAVAFWPKEKHSELLANQELETQLQWVSYYNSKRKTLTREELFTCEHLLTTFKEYRSRSETINFQIIPDWIIGYEDESCFEKIGNQVLSHYFLKINEESWIKLLTAFSFKPLERLFGIVGREGNLAKLWQLTHVLHAFLDYEPGKKLVETIVPELPIFFSFFESDKAETPLVKPKVLKILLDLETAFPQKNEWSDSLKEIFTSFEDRNYCNGTLAAVLLDSGLTSNLARKLLSYLKADLQQRVKNKPAPPSDWTRPLPEERGRVSSGLAILRKFMASPVEQIFDFKALQRDRIELENLVLRSELDLRTETIRKGSPHTLRIIKTQANYERLLDQWHEDELLLRKIDRLPN